MTDIGYESQRMPLTCRMFAYLVVGLLHNQVSTERLNQGSECILQSWVSEVAFCPRMCTIDVLCGQ